MYVVWCHISPTHVRGYDDTRSKRIDGYGVVEEAARPPMVTKAMYDG
jgi:hypothetical protein